MPNPSIAVFDLDGTLADTAPDLVATLNILLDKENLAPLPLKEGRILIGAGARALIKKGFAVSQKPLDESRLDNLFQDFLHIYGNHLCVKTSLYEGVENAMDWLEEKGFALAVCTNKMTAHSVSLLNQLGIGNRFKAICGRDAFPVYKPDPLHLSGTIEKAGGTLQGSIMIGDSRTDIDTARAVGVPVYAVTFGYTDVHVSELSPDGTFDHYDDLKNIVF